MGSTRPPTGDFRTKIDEEYMTRALGLARATVGLASPNPQVGCVVVRDGVVVGEGSHVYEGRDHAEIVALRRAGPMARGAAAYVTLEPCSHHGRTGPCADALIAAGVRWVVASTIDPNPMVGGEGFAKLRAGEVEVAVGVMEREARALNDGFARWIRTGRPLVTLKAALSADGMLAPPPSERAGRQVFWLTGVEAQAEVQRMRHGADAVLTGIDTVLADDPLLTDRSGLRRRRPLLRVVLDSALRMPLDSKMVKGAQNDLVIFTVSKDEARIQELRTRGVRVEVLPAEAGRVPLGKLLDKLGDEGILTMITETGTRLNTALLAGGLVDRVHLFVSPQIMGSDAVPAFRGMPQAIRMAEVEVERYGNDLGLCSLLKDPWEKTGNRE